MVTAGVFLVARMCPVFECAGALTVRHGDRRVHGVLSRATVGCQNDIKRVIAYSTCSQLGLHVLRCGVGAYRCAIFHLLTHAFFKALLFLALAV